MLLILGGSFYKEFENARPFGSRVFVFWTACTVLNG